MKTGIYAVIFYIVTLLVHYAVSANNQVAPIYQAQVGNTSNFGQQLPNSNVNVNVNSNANVQQVQSNNPFLEYYNKQGNTLLKDNISFYFRDKNNTLQKRQLTSSAQKKSVMVFFGDWCPHCDAFLKTFSQHIDLLRLSDVTIIFVAVPSISKLKNWTEPTIDEFNTAERKIESYGIKLSSSKTFVVMISHPSTLSICGVEGLPVMIALQNGKEKFRAVGEKAVQKMNLSNTLVLKQFLEIWDDDQQHAIDETSNNRDSSLVCVCDTNPKFTKAARKRTALDKTKSKQVSQKVDWKRARELTELLNEYDYSKMRQPGLLFY